MKHCDNEATLGMTIVLAGLRIEVEFCEKHFDVLDWADDWGPSRA